MKESTKVSLVVFFVYAFFLCSGNLLFSFESVCCFFGACFVEGRKCEMIICD